MLPASPHIQGVDEVFDGEYCFIIHASRRSGKTTYFNSLTDEIRAETNFYGLLINLLFISLVVEA
jgi:hypothetical protein